MNSELNAIVMPNGRLHLEWTETKERISKSTALLQEEIYRRFRSDTDSWLLFSGFCDRQVRLSPSLGFWRDFTGLFAHKLSRTPDMETLRHNADISIQKDELRQVLNSVPMMTGAEYLHTNLLEKTWSEIQKRFANALRSSEGSVEDFIKTYSPDVHLVGRIFFHLVENAKDESRPFAFLATYSTRLNKAGKSKHLPLRHALEEYGEDSEKLLELLTTVHLAAKQSDLITELLETGELFHPLAWKPGDAFAFLKEIPIYENAGILCRIPNWWKGNASGLKLDVSLGDKQPSFVGMDALLNFNARLFLGGMEISEEEARRLLSESEGLAFIKNKWIAVDPEKLRQTLDAYEKAKKLMAKEGLSIREALRLQFNPGKLLGIEDEGIDAGVSNGEWLESVMRKLVNPELTPSVKPGRTFKAKLRAYQKKGLNWLSFLDSLQFGACLADDMGLGKTVQLLAFLNVIRLKKIRQASLLIIPASLISNWVNEIHRFSPNLKYFVAHPDAGKSKQVKPKTKKSLDALDLVITTYALSHRYEWLQSYSWNYVILDEAQAIKNPMTKQSKSIRKFKAHNRIAMTGTPIENRLRDLWSLFDFLNPGLLGDTKEFTRFSKQLKDDNTGYSRLRKIIRPYILRRLKTDRKVISDLPDKVEMKSYAPLSKKQTLLYAKIVEQIRRSLEDTNGIKRKGMILAAIMKFKQLCNHPDQYLGTGGYDEKHSGKFTRLREICETIYQKREKVLVFTQFKEMTAPLSEFLEGIFGRKGQVLHGSIPVGKRKKIIAEFQSPEYVPFMVLSLKAGGVGLNLTEANHVIHFDRWWNPAVENQATDRAFRIGQKKNVIVHKFLTRGTVEEKIDQMLEEKSRLSEDVVASTGEAWVTEMENDELMDLFRLTI